MVLLNPKNLMSAVALFRHCLGGGGRWHFGAVPLSPEITAHSQMHCLGMAVAFLRWVGWSRELRELESGESTQISCPQLAEGVFGGGV